jgi:hypothetical protein
MSTTSTPFGFQPVYHASGFVRPAAFTLANTAAVTLLQYQPGAINTSTGVVTPATVGDSFVGTFMGVEFTDGDGRRRVSNKFLANTPATEVTAYITRDPAIVYQIQANGPVNISNIGNQYNFGSITTGSTVIGLSTAVLDTASVVASGSTAQMRVIGITPGPDNDWGDAFTIVQVQISEHQDVATINAY